MAADEVHVAIWAPLGRADLPGLFTRVCLLLEQTRPAILVCDVSALPKADAVTVDALARLALAARRRGCRVRLGGASGELCALVALMGLADVLGSPAPG